MKINTVSGTAIGRDDEPLRQRTTARTAVGRPGKCAYHALAGALLLVLSAGAGAADDPLTRQLTEFMLRLYPSPPQSLQIMIKTPAQRRLSCEHPQFSLPSRNRIWGNLSIAMVCDTQKRFLQAEVQVTDRYLVAARPIAARQTLTSADAVWRTGRLDMLNSVPLTDMALVPGSISERAVGTGQPLTGAMLRRAWRVENGQPVRIMARGEGFAVQSTGKALNNAAVNEQVRVRMDTGQVVNGQVMENGDVLLLL